MSILPRASAGLLSVSALLLGVAPFLSHDQALPEVGCEDLATTSWGGFTIDEVEEKPAGAGNPAHCVVRGTIDTEIHFELLPEIAPNTVAHFKTLITTGFYTNTYFHRVLPGFMIQGGDPNSKDRDPRNDGNGGMGHAIEDEFSALSHARGIVAMANKGHGTASSQFFIVQEDSPHLDGHYTIFGRVVEGMDVVDAITELEIDQFGRWGPRDRPYPVQAVVGGSRIEGDGEVESGVTASAGAVGAS